MRYGTNTNLSSLLDQKVDILQLMHDEDSAAYVGQGDRRRILRAVRAAVEWKRHGS